MLSVRIDIDNASDTTVRVDDTAFGQVPAAKSTRSQQARTVTPSVGLEIWPGVKAPRATPEASE